MNEENLGILNARHLVRDKYDDAKPCTLLLTRNRIIAVTIEGINPWTVVTVIVALAASFTSFLLRNFVLFLGGLGVGIIAGLLIGLIDFVIRHKVLRKMKRLNPERILEMNEKNFEMRYKNIVKVRVRTVSTYPRRSDFIPYFQEHRYIIDLVTNEEKHTFVFDGRQLHQFLDIFHQFAPETAEIEQDEVA